MFALLRGISMSTTNFLVKPYNKTKKEEESTPKILCTKRSSHTPGKKFEVKVSDDEVPTTQFSTIDHLRKYDTNWLLMVKVLRRGTIVTFNNNMCSGELWKVILIDDEGARIQALMFTDAIAKFGDLFNEDKTYLISNGVVNSTNKKFSNVHKDIELSLTINTNVQEAETEILPYHKF
ncbi:unnamed protein product [Ilex paraguariensis]|uniref:Replication protein A 70 kDa DNA-binding subunit B/D first OB fold domain-containing protein n=1 Tax=Ilex paraguariensis TaxID=185542 RepID=A0ABC8RDA5_9AQUA